MLQQGASVLWNSCVTLMKIIGLCLVRRFSLPWLSGSLLRRNTQKVQAFEVADIHDSSSQLSLKPFLSCCFFPRVEELSRFTATSCCGEENSSLSGTVLKPCNRQDMASWGVEQQSFHHGWSYGGGWSGGAFWVWSCSLCKFLNRFDRNKC